MGSDAFNYKVESSEGEELFNTMLNFMLKLMSSDSNIIDMIDKGLEATSCISNVEIEVPPGEVRTRDIARLLSDPDVKRGIYVMLSLLKALGSCYNKDSPSKA